MTNNKLDLLLRKQKGKKIFNEYKSIFLSAGIDAIELKHIPLPDCDTILNEVKSRFPVVEMQVEELTEDNSANGSRLLTKALEYKSATDNCYIYSDDVYYCGMFLVKRKIAIENSLNIAKRGYSNSCRILAEYLEYSLTIDFHRMGTLDIKNLFEIQAKFI